MSSTEAAQHVWEDDEGNLVVVVDLPAAGDRPAGPREYVIADVSTRTGRWIAVMTEKAQAAQRRLDAGEDEDTVIEDLHLDETQQRNLYEEVLGSTLEDLEDDEVPWRRTKEIGQIAYSWVVAGLEGARRCWEADADPKPANREERRAAAKKTTKRGSGSRSSASGASANTTPRAASTRSTKTRS